MKYLGIKPTDFNNGDGINVSFWVSGCPHHCKGCHNPESWDPNKGTEFTLAAVCDVLREMDKIWKPDLAILGGEPLADYNYKDVENLCYFVKQAYPDRKIWLWTGYILADLQAEDKLEILEYIDFLITGGYVESERDTTLKYKGSKNQTVWKVDGGKLESWK